MLRQGLQTFADKQVSMRFEVSYAGLQGEPTNQMVNTLGDYLHMNKVKQISPLDETWHGVSASACVRDVVQKEPQARLRLYGKDIHSLSLETPGLKHTSSDLQKRRVVHEVSKACAKKDPVKFWWENIRISATPITEKCHAEEREGGSSPSTLCCSAGRMWYWQKGDAENDCQA